MLLITSDDNTGMQNLLSLVTPYGVSAVPGMVYDENTSYYKTTQYNLVPDVNTSHNVTSPASDYTMIMPEAHGIKVSDNTGAAVVTKLFTTSDLAYSQVGDTKSAAGSLALGVAIENETEGGATRIVWYSSTDAFTDETAASVSYGNYYYFFYSLFWANETYTSALSDVVGVPTTEPLLSGLTETTTIVWAVIFAAVIPLTVIVWGLVIWLRRRAR
jgi:ABC-2 type transport system permease protein